MRMETRIILSSFSYPSFRLVMPCLLVCIYAYVFVHVYICMCMIGNENEIYSSLRNY